MQNFKDKVYLAVIMLLLIGFTFAASHARQPPTAPGASNNGRYQLVAPSDAIVYVLDTRTGQAWRRGFFVNGNSPWIKLEALPAEIPPK